MKIHENARLLLRLARKDLRSGVYQAAVSEITIYELRKAPGEFVVKAVDLFSELEAVNLQYGYSLIDIRTP